MTAKEKGSRVVKAFFIGGVILGFLGISGVFWLSLPDTETMLVADSTYIRLDGRYFGHLSGSYSCSLNLTGMGFVVLDQQDWDLRGTGHQSDPVLVSYAHDADQMNFSTFSANLPASEAYFMYFFYTSPPYPDYPGPITVEVHWHIWGPTVDFSSVYSALVLAGIACVVSSYYYRWRLFMTTSKKGI